MTPSSPRSQRGFERLNGPEKLEDRITPSVATYGALEAQSALLRHDLDGALQDVVQMKDIAKGEASIDRYEEAVIAALAQSEQDLISDAALYSLHANTRTSLLDSLAKVTTYESQVAVATQSLADAQKTLDAARQTLASDQSALDAALRSYQAKQAVVATLEQKLAEAKNTYTALLPKVYASDLFFSASTNGWGSVERDRSNGETGATDGRTESIRGVTYQRGLGVHANSSIDIPANGQFATFESVIGVDDETNGNGSVIFQVWGDGKKLFDSGVMTGTMPGRAISVDVRGVQKVQLVVTNAGDGSNSDHADWANARFTYADSGGTRAVQVSDLFFISSQNALGPVERNMSNGGSGALDGRTMVIKGVSYARGLGVKSSSSVSFRTDGAYGVFQSVIGIDDETKGTAGAIFQVWGDGKKLYDSGTITAKTGPKSIAVPIAGVKSVTLMVLRADGKTSVSADWANPQFVFADNGLAAARTLVADTDQKLQVAKTDLANDKQVPTAQAAVAASQDRVRSAETAVTGATNALQGAQSALNGAKTSRDALDAAFTAQSTAIDALPEPPVRVAQELQESLDAVGMDWSPATDRSVPQSIASLFRALSEDELLREQQEEREFAETLEALRLGDRIAVAFAYDQFVQTAADMPRLIAETQKIIDNAYLTPPWYRDQMWQIGLSYRIGDLNRYKNLLALAEQGIAASKAILATTPETLPTTPQLDVLGINQNKLVVQAYAPGAHTLEFNVSWNAGDRYGMQTVMTVPATTSPDIGLPVGVIPFNGLMGGSVEANRSQKYEVRLMIDGKPGPTVWVEWYPASRGLGVHWETASNFESYPATLTAAPEPAAGELAQIRDYSALLATHIAPHYEPISINNSAVAANVPYSVWSATGLSSIIATSFLEDSRAALVQRDYASLIATGWKPGEVEWDNAWKAVYRASEDLVHAANDYAGYLIAKNAGYEVGSFDFSRLDKGYFPLFPTKDQVKEAVETHSFEIYQAIQGRQAEDVAYQQMLENRWRQFYVSSGQDAIDRAKEDAKMLGSAARAGASQEILISMAKSLGPAALEQALTGGVSWIRAEDIAALQNAQTVMLVQQQNLVSSSGDVGGSPTGNPDSAPSVMINNSPDTPTLSVFIQHSGLQGTDVQNAANGVLNGLTQRDLYVSIVNRNDWKVSAPTVITSSAMRTDTPAGRIIVNAANQIRTTTSRYAQLSIAFTVQLLTDIPASRLMEIASAATPAAAGDVLQKLITDAQYGHLLSGTQRNLSVLTAAPDKPAYSMDDNEIRIRFDVATEGRSIRRVEVYYGGKLIDITTAATYIRIPISALPTIAVNVGPSPLTQDQYQQWLLMQSAQVQYALTMNVIFEDGTALKDAPIQTFSMPRNLPSMKRGETMVPVGNFSTLPEGDANREAQNTILSAFYQNFPVKNPSQLANTWDSSGWRWELGSGFHGNDEYNAMDINYLEGESDRGLPVYAIADGVITSISGTYGAVTIEHTLNGVTWRTEYMHMLIYPAGSDGSFVIRDKDGHDLKIIKKDDAVKQGDLIGTIGGMGPSGDRSFGSHSHIVNFQNVGGEWKSIDSRNVISALKINIKAFDSGLDGIPGTTADNTGFDVVWNDQVGTFVPKDGTMLCYDRSALETSSKGSAPSYWKAWEAGKKLEDMERVVLTKVDEIQVNGKSQSIMRWVRVGSTNWNTGKNIWDSLSQSWIDYMRS